MLTAPRPAWLQTPRRSAREHAFNLVVLSLWDDPRDDARHVAWTRELDAAMRPWSAEPVYVNALSQDDRTRVAEAYGGNYARLREVKTQYDPANRFRQNHNITPLANRANSRRRD